MLTRRMILINLMASFLLALFFIFLGSDSLTYVIRSKYFLSDLWVSVTLCFVLLSYLSLLIKYLEGRYHWLEHFYKRMIYQLITGVIIPSGFVFIGMYVYFFNIQGYKIEDVHFFYGEYPVSIVIIIALNITYGAYFFYRENKRQKRQLINLEHQLYTLQSEPASKTNGGIIENKIKTFIAISGNKNIPIAVGDICCFYKEGNYTQFKTFQSKTYLLNHTLDDLLKLLDEMQFFRVNRQFIINRKACHYFTNEENGKLELFLDPSHDQEIIISQKRAPAFKEWLNS